jgi:hypothetical protein
MEKLRLRPHHLDFVYYGKSRLGRDLLLSMYNEEFVQNLERLKVSVSDKTLVEIVLGADYLCEDCKCPYDALCKAKRYDVVNERMVENLKRDVPSYMGMISYKLREENPETADASAIVKMKLIVGKTYEFGSIRELI